MKKVKLFSLTKLQIEFLSMSLKEAKTNVDEILEGNEVVINIDSFDLAKKFVKKARLLGVICDLDNTMKK